MLHDEEHLFHPLKHRKIDSLRKLGLNFMQNKVWDIDVAMHEVNTVIKAKLLLGGACGGAVGWGTALQAGRSRV